MVEEGWRTLLVMGVDAEPDGRSYSVVVLRDGRLVSKYEGVPLHRLIRLVWELKPNILALDNVFELGDGEDELRRVLAMLPDSVEVVQVTWGADGSFESVRRLAEEAGVKVRPGKLSPTKTAYLVALLAEKGYGSRVRFLEEKTKIIVSKARSTGAGGMSQSRYQRRLRAAILRAVRDIKRALDRHRLDYDLVFRKSGGGIDSAVFIVYAPRNKLYGVVKPHHGNDVRVEIKPVYGGRIYFEEKEARRPLRYVIVGVDPGMSTGIAVIDLMGNVLLAETRKGVDRGDIIDLISRIGHPILVATDVKPVPDFVKKLAAKLGVPVFEPPQSLSVAEKRRLLEAVSSARIPLEKLDSHARDALAAALKALQHYSKKLSQIESYIEKLGIDVDVEHVKALVIKGMTIAEALEEEIKRRLLHGDDGILVKSFRRSVEHREPPQPSQEEVRRLREEVERLTAENRMLAAKLRKLAEELENVKLEYRVLKREVSERIEHDRILAMLRHENQVLRSEVEKLRKEREELQNQVTRLRDLIRSLLSHSIVLAPVVQTLTMESLREAARTRAPILVAYDTSAATKDVADSLHRMGVIGVLVPRREVERARMLLESAGVPVLALEDYAVEVVDDVAALRADVVTELSIALMRLRERSERRLIDYARLKSLIEEYRAMRLKELLGSEEETAQQL